MTHRHICKDCGEAVFDTPETAKLRAALAPFAAIAAAVEHTDKRDGDVVHRQRDPDGRYLELTKDDFRRAAAALT